MKKVNFTKVDAVLSDGLVKMSADKLLKETGYQNKDEPQDIDKVKFLKHLVKRINQYASKDKNFFEKIGTSKEQLIQILQKDALLTKEDWELLRALNSKIDTYKENLNDEELIENQRIKHVNKRFNTKDTWLPLH